MTAGTENFEAGPSDSSLVARVLGGDQTAFATVYDRYADRLYDFAHSMLRNTEDASDAVADAFIKFAERLPQLREPDRLRPWLYAIVRTECLRRLKSRSRVAFGGDEQLVDMNSSLPFRRSAVWLCNTCSHQCPTTYSGMYTVTTSRGLLVWTSFT